MDCVKNILRKIAIQSNNDTSECRKLAAEGLEILTIKDQELDVVDKLQQYTLDMGIGDMCSDAAFEITCLRNQVSKLLTKTIKAIYIKDAEGLDPITVYIENYELGRGQITIACYTTAWTGFCGAMSNRTVEKFFIDCNSDYLAGNLMSSNCMLRNEENETYLIKVIDAVKSALNTNLVD